MRGGYIWEPATRFKVQGFLKLSPKQLIRNLVRINNKSDNPEYLQP